jgi:hypothetical protein
LRRRNRALHALCINGRTMRPWRFTLCLIVALATGCAGPRAPGLIDVSAVDFQARNDPVTVFVDGPGSKGRGARRGAAAGAGVGVLLGGMLCLAAGPLAVMCAGPALGVAAVSTATGAVTGAVTAETAAEMEAKQKFLADSLARQPFAEQLAARLREGARADAAVAVAPAWQAEVRLVELSTVGSGQDRPFRLRLVGRIELRAAGGGEPLFVKDYEVLAKASRRIEDWRSDDGASLRATLAESVDALAAQILAELKAAR